MTHFSMCSIAILQSDVLLSSTSPFYSEDSGRFQWAEGDFFSLSVNNGFSGTNLHIL